MFLANYFFQIQEGNSDYIGGRKNRLKSQYSTESSSSKEPIIEEIPVEIEMQQNARNYRKYVYF